MRAAGFGDCHEWMIWTHDEYGNNIQLLWSNHEITENNETELSQHEEDLDELDVVLEEAFEDLMLVNNSKKKISICDSNFLIFPAQKLMKY